MAPADERRGLAHGRGQTGGGHLPRPDAVEHWVGEASEGRFEIDAVDGWLAGVPTCVLAGELENPALRERVQELRAAVPA